MSKEIAIISAPDIKEDQVRNLIYAIEAEGNLPFPVYITKARLNPLSKKDILDCVETFIRIATEAGWGKDVSERLEGMRNE